MVALSRSLSERVPVSQLKRLVAVLSLFALAACGTTRLPEPAGPLGPRSMVAAANPLAAEAGMKILRTGGGAVDAAVAVQAVLGLVEPQSSGLGGGAFMTYYDARTKSVTAYDGREVAPAGAPPDMFMGPDGKPLPFREAVISGQATGAPGAIAMLALAQAEHGKKPWKDLFREAE